MTGACLRTKRGGKWESIEVEHLTKEERREHLSKRDMEEVMCWMDLLCEVIAQADTEPDSIVSDGNPSNKGD